ncbi:MAG: type II secretion system secretin GspD [Polyangiaceae bacterium]|nr:type II secretion system secretin GspD [Polyangiaceae bacterium]
MKRRFVAAACGALLALWPLAAQAQLNPRGKPVVKKPAGAQAEPDAKPADPGAKPADPGAKPGDPAAPGGAPGAAPGKKDPLSNLAAPPDIEYKPPPPGQKFKFNLEDTDLPALVKAVSQITGRRFIYGNKLHQLKVTVFSPDEVTAGEAYAAFLAILNSNGLTVIPHGAFLEIVESQGASHQPTPIFGTATPVPQEDRFVTRLYRVNNIDAGEVAGLLTTNFKSPDASIATYPPGNLLIVTDTGANIRRMLRIVEELDVGSAGDQIWVQPVYNSSASEAAQKLNEILGKGGKDGAGAVIPDDRTNSLIITATKNDYDKILELIKRVVDAPVTEGDSQIHVLPLQHAQCDELSTSLQLILGGGGGARPPTGGARPGGRGATAAPAGGAGGQGNEEIFEGSVRVGCDTATNSLLTTSSLRDYAQLRAVVDQLDQPRRQVFIEAVIMDLNVNNTLDLGIAYHGGSTFDMLGPDDSAVYGGNNLGQSVTGLPAELGALALGVRGPELEGTENIFGTGISIPALGVVLHALGTDGNSNVLATPHILATDNVQADISVGQSVPLQTNVGGAAGLLSQVAGQQAGAAGLTGALGGLGGLLGGGFSAPYKDVGIKLSIKPHVNDSDQVRLEIKEEISEVGSSPQGTLGAVSINQRTASTTLIVRDQQTVVIGGLMRDQETVSQTKIPILGDIPILGALFRQHKTTKAKTNLLLILTPYVVRDQDDLRAIFERKMQERQEFLDRYFVFSEDSAWEPPRDFSRTNGLVESIRQTMMEEMERERLIAESQPRAARVHMAVEPISLPSMSAPPSLRSGSSAASSGGGDESPRPKPSTTTTTQPPRGRIKPSAPLPTPTPKTDRVE